MATAPHHDRSTKAARASRWLLAATIAGAALAVGTVHTVTLCVVAGALAGAVLLSEWRAEPARARPAATLLLVTGAALTAYTALQCVPLPIRLLTVIAPHNAEVWAHALDALREPGPRWAPISVDPTATRVELLKGVAYLLAFVAALRVARKREGAAFLGATVIATGLALAATALLHPALGAHRLYGVWTPSMNFGRHLAPFLNPNNLAGYLNIGFCVALAAALAPEPRLARPILLACALTLAATQVWVASRAGVLAMLLGAALVVAISRTGRANGRRMVASASLIAAVIAGAGVFMIVLGHSDEASGELLATEMSKVRLISETLRMVPAYPIFGAGRGAFETAFPAFRESLGYALYGYPENVVAQWLVEWGLPFGLAGLVAIAVALRPNSVLARSSTAGGAWAALVAVAVQNLFDLGTEIPGLMLACVVCAAIVVGGVAGRDAQSRLARWTAASRALTLVGAGAALIAIAMAASGIGQEVHEERLVLYDSLVDGRPDPGEVRNMVRAAILRHPSEPYLPFVAAMREARDPDGHPVAWIEATLERAPVYAPAHLLLARFLALQAPAQARMEYRVAMEQSLDFLPTIVTEVPRLVGGYYDATEVVPSGQGKAWVLERLATALQARLPATSARLDDELAAVAPTEPGPILRSSNGVLADLSAGTGAPWCENEGRPRCIKRALEGAKHAGALAPLLCEPHLIEAKAEKAGGDVAGGLDRLLQAVDALPADGERVECLQSVEAMAVDFHDEPRATAAIAKIANLGCAEAAECGRNLAWAAGAEERLGHYQTALSLYRRARATNLDADDILESIARLAADAGLHVEAAENYEDLARRHPTQQGWVKAATGERAAAAKGALNL